MAENQCSPDCCPECPQGYVCACLHVTEDMVLDAIALGAQNFVELRKLTAAGDGCTACHGRLKDYLQKCADGEIEITQRRQPLATV